MLSGTELQRKLAEGAPRIADAFFKLAEHWLQPVGQKLENFRAKHEFPKTFNDPIWGVIELYPWEVLLLDSQLLQRLRGVCQLGLAHLVYPGARHSRLEHSLGVVEAAERMVRSLEHNAQHRKEFGRDRDENVPSITPMDRFGIRIAALLHDIGHGPFSHATEALVDQNYNTEYRACSEILKTTFADVKSIAPAEINAVLMTMSPAMTKVLSHPALGIPIGDKTILGPSIVARILGSRSYLDATYLSGVISGPIDADKLDYMARDSHHSGLPIALDIVRLIGKLEVVVVTPKNAFNPELRDRAERSANHRYYEMGISLAGLGAYEQMLIGRVMLYDRIYYHHKIRAAEEMVRVLIRQAETDRRKSFTIDHFFQSISDETFVAGLGGRIATNPAISGGPRSEWLSQRILDRQIYHRAFAFAQRFIRGIDKLAPEDADDLKASIWVAVLALGDEAKCRLVAAKICEKARRVAENLQEFAAGSDIEPHEILIDLPTKEIVVRGGAILTRTEDGQIGRPNLCFDGERWSEAYEHQKHCGFVFCPKSRIPIVSLAAKIIFWEEFRLAQDHGADRACKRVSSAQDADIRAIGAAGVCDADCVEALAGTLTPYRLFHVGDFDLDPQLILAEPLLRDQLANQLQEIFPDGIPQRVHSEFCQGIDALSRLIVAAERGGWFVNAENLVERALQEKVADFLRAGGLSVSEATNLSGGETDLVLNDLIVIENKVERVSRAIDAVLSPKYGLQARRYSLALSSSVAFVVVAYRPADEEALPQLSRRIRVTDAMKSNDPFAAVEILLPWGHSVPSRAGSKSGS